MVTCGVRLACGGALLLAVRFAVSFDLQLEATSATPTNAAHASATRAPVQKRLSLPAEFFMSISALKLILMKS